MPPVARYQRRVFEIDIPADWQETRALSDWLSKAANDGLEISEVNTTKEGRMILVARGS